MSMIFVTYSWLTVAMVSFHRTFTSVEGWSTEASAMQWGNPRRGWLPQRSNGWRQTATERGFRFGKKRGSRRWVEFWLESEFHVDCWLLGNLSWIALRFIHKIRATIWQQESNRFSLQRCGRFSCLGAKWVGVFFSQDVGHEHRSAKCNSGRQWYQIRVFLGVCLLVFQAGRPFHQD